MSDEPKTADACKSEPHSFRHFKWATAIAVLAYVPIAILWGPGNTIVWLIVALTIIAQLWVGEAHEVADDSY